ncbi:MAG: hypothetical protein ACLPVW_06040 [Terriglobales bacterium]
MDPERPLGNNRDDDPVEELLRVWERLREIWQRLFPAREAPVVKTKEHYTAELGIEFCIELVLVFYQLGRDLMGLPVNVPLGAGCWVIAMLIAIRILWILPITSAAPGFIKIVASVLIFVVAAAVSKNTIAEAYRKQHAGEPLSRDTQMLLGAMGGLQKGIETLKPNKPDIPAVNPPQKRSHAITGAELLVNDDLRKQATDVAGKLRGAYMTMKLRSDFLETKEFVTHDPKQRQQVRAQREEVQHDLVANNEELITSANHLRRTMLERLGRDTSVMDRDPWFTGNEFVTQTDKLKALANELPK